MLFFIAVGGMGVPLLLVWALMHTKLKDTHQSAAFLVLWAPAALGGAYGGVLLARLLGLGD